MKDQAMRIMNVSFYLIMLAGNMLYSEYISYKKIHPGQLRYASKNVEEKRKKAIEVGAATWDNNNQWHYKYNHGTSIMAENNALPVVMAPFGYVLVDGHHDVLASIALGAEFIPIKVVDDMSSLNPNDFWLKAEKQGFVYPYAIGGARQVPPEQFDQLIDDPNRYFAAISARKCDKLGDAPNNSKGADYPLWIKIGKDIPFIEFMIADALWNNNLLYIYSMGNNPPKEFVEKARAILKRANIKGLKLIPQRKYYFEIKNICGTLEPINTYTL